MDNLRKTGNIYQKKDFKNIPISGFYFCQVASVVAYEVAPPAGHGVPVPFPADSTTGFMASLQKETDSQSNVKEKKHFQLKD